MKIAISGKGGVGKTTISALIARYLSDSGYKVLAIDADPAMNLPGQIGIKMDEEKKIKPLSSMKEFIEERTGAKRGEYGGFFKMNPKVDDIPDTYSLTFDRIKVLVLGSINKGGGGCFCPENVLLKNLLSYILIERDEWVVVDMDAGLEHLGRGTAKYVDRLIVVVEPGIQSIKTALRIKELAKDLDIGSVSLIANKISKEEDLVFVKENAPNIPILGYLSLDERIRDSDRLGLSPYDADAKIREEIASIVNSMIRPQ